MGKAVARLLAEKGANVIIVARNVEKLEEALKYISVCSRQDRIAQELAETVTRNPFRNTHLSAFTTSAPIWQIPQKQSASFQKQRHGTTTSLQT